MKCEQYNNAILDEKVQLEEEYKLHIDRKDKARVEKALDKAKALVLNSDWHAVTADLRAFYILLVVMFPLCITHVKFHFTILLCIIRCLERASVYC